MKANMKVKKHFIIRKYITWSMITAKVTLLQQYSRFIWDKILLCSGKPSDYQRLNNLEQSSQSDFSEEGNDEYSMSSASCRYDSDCDFISVKIIVLGDCKIGKTTFVVSSY